MRRSWNSHRLVDEYEELKHIEQTEGLSPGGEHDLKVLEWVLFGK